jgi:hypothetical protein
MKNLSQLSVFRLPNEDAATLFKLTYEIAEPVSNTIGEMGLAAYTAGYKSMLPFFAQISQIQKSEFTGQITSVRAVCNDLSSEINRVITFETKSRVSTKKDAANMLKFDLKPYWDLSRKSIAIQFEKTDEMIEKINNSPELKAAAIEIKIDTILTELETKNTTLTKLYKDRLQEVSSRDESSTNLRPEAQEGYRLFCEVIELATHFTPNQDLTNLFNQMDELRVKYRAMLPAEETITDEEADEVDTEM